MHALLQPDWMTAQMCRDVLDATVRPSGRVLPLTVRWHAGIDWETREPSVATGEAGEEELDA